MRMPAAVMLGLLDAAGKKHQGNGGHRPAEDQKGNFRAGQGGKVVSPENCAYRIKPRARGSTDRVSMQMEDLAPGPDALLQRPIQGEAQGDDNGQVRHIAIEHHGIHDPNESQSRGHPLHGGKSLPENQRADEDGEQGFMYRPGSPPVCAR